MSTVKEHVIRFVEGMPEDVTFEELEKKLFKEVQYRRYVQKTIEAGLRDVEAGRTYSNEEVMKHFGFDS